MLVGLGGSATTDGGLGALQALGSPARLRAVDLQVACDVRTRFADAATVFAPQKGATAAQVRLLHARLEHLADRYRTEHGVDVLDVDGSGAAGGLAGGLLAVGARLLPGFDVVADHVDLDARLDAADLVITGEGYLDAQSLEGKVVGGVCALATQRGLRVVVVAGDADADARRLLGDTPVVSLVDEFGARAFAEPRWCIEHAVRRVLESPR